YAWRNREMSGRAREDRRLGDIYHSSPVVIGPPSEDLADESYNLYRDRPVVQDRPTVAYVGTNDGILHAFAVEDTEITTGPHAGVTIEAGQELWGFIPPMFLQKLKSAMSSHQFMVDGTPVVKEVFTRRFAGDQPDGLIYRTILIVGMRGGGEGYIAVDVTDPLDPRFLWQFAHDDMGFTYGQAGIGQVLVEGSDGLQERAFALLPGGTGTDLSDPDSGCGAAEDLDGDGEYDKPLGCPSRGKGTPPVNEGTTTARENIPCFDTQGRRLFFIDVATGERIGLFDDTTFNAPLTGGVSMFPGQTGRIANRAYITDDAGVIWRIDMSSPKMSEWFADPLHDIFWDGEAYDGQPAYNPPIVSTDNQGNAVLVQATGNIDDLDGTAANRVVSLTEEITFADDGSVDEIAAKLNWEIRLEEGEQVTGPLELFNGDVYFGSFQSSPDLTNACEFGQSRLWGVEYIDSEEDSDLPKGVLPHPTDPDTFERFRGPFENQLVMGVQVAQRPSCVSFSEVSVTDPYFGADTATQVTGQGGGKFELVALVGGDGVKKSGSDVGELDAPPMQQPVFYTEVHGLAGSVQ
ncbi:MAG: pilus assembly protein, partial [Polyangiales bacterium]